MEIMSLNGLICSILKNTQLATACAKTLFHFQSLLRNTDLFIYYMTLYYILLYYFVITDIFSVYSLY